MKKTVLLALSAALALSACNKGSNPGNAAKTTGGGVAALAAQSNTDWTKTVVATPEGGFRMGNPDAPVKIVEFASMTCSHCAEFSAAAHAALEDKYIKSGKVSFEFRNFVRDQIDVVASLLARCGGPAPFFAITQQMFAEQPEIFKRLEANAAQLKAAEGLPGQQTFVRVAEVAGLDKFVGMRGIPASKANACLTNKADLDKLVAMNQEGANKYKIPGTPTFLMNGKMVDAPPVGTEVWPDLARKMDAALGAA